MNVQSYAEFISAYTTTEKPVPPTRFPPPDHDRIIEMLLLEHEIGSSGGRPLDPQLIAGFVAHLTLMSELLTELAPLLAREARRLVEKGLIEKGGQPGQFTIAKTEVDGKALPAVGPREKQLGRLKNVGASVRGAFKSPIGPRRRKTGHTPTPGEVQTTGRHAKNYAAASGAALVKEAGINTNPTGPDELASGTSGGLEGLPAGTPEVEGLGDFLAALTTGYHGVQMYGVLLKKLTASEKAKLGLVMKFLAAEKVLRGLLAGDAAATVSDLTAMDFWATLSSWPDAAKLVSEVIRRFNLRRAQADGPVSGRPLQMKAAQQTADTQQGQAGYFRDLSLVPGGASLARGMLEVLGHLDALGFVGPLGAMAGALDLMQGVPELEAAKLTKLMFKLRVAALGSLQQEASGNELNNAYLTTMLGYCQRKKKIASKEKFAAGSRLAVGIVRVATGATGVASTAPLLGLAALLPGAAAAAPALGYLTAAGATFAALYFAAMMSLRQNWRAKEESQQKWDERDNKAMRATHSLQSLRDAYLQGFNLRYGRGDLVDSEQGYAGEHQASYEDGANESMTVDMMALDIMESMAEGTLDTCFPMKMLRLDPADGLLLRRTVRSLWHQGRLEEAHLAIANAIRRAYDMPPPRSTEAVQPMQFVASFEVAEQSAQRLAGQGRQPDPAEVARIMFSPVDEGGIEVDRKVFLQSMEVLKAAFEKFSDELDRGGVYARMLEFSTQIPSEPVRTKEAAQRHLQTWTRLRATQAGWSDDLARSHQHVERLLELAADRREPTWHGQLQAAIDELCSDRTGEARQGFCRFLIEDIRSLGDAGLLKGVSAVLATDLIREIEQVAHPDGSQAEAITPVWAEEWEPLTVARGEHGVMLKEIQKLLVIAANKKGRPDRQLKAAIRKRAEADQRDVYIKDCLDTLDAIKGELTGPQNFIVQQLRRELMQLRGTRH